MSSMTPFFSLCNSFLTIDLFILISFFVQENLFQYHFILLLQNIQVSLILFDNFYFDFPRKLISILLYFTLSLIDFSFDFVFHQSLFQYYFILL